MSVHIIFAIDENIQFFKTTINLSYDQKCSPFGDLTNVSHDLKLLTLVQRLRYLHHSQAAPLATHFWYQIQHRYTELQAT